MFSTGQNPNHPKKGSAIKVEPIRNVSDIQAIKRLLADQPRNLCLFTLGINTAYRASELLSITIDQVKYAKAGDRLELKQSKNQRYRATTLNNNAVHSIQTWLKVHPLSDLGDAPLFLSQVRCEALTVSAVNQLMKGWCCAIDLRGNYGSHSMRKTWGYHQRVGHDTSVALLMEAFGHSKELQTLNYLCIQSDEIQQLYTRMEL